MFVGTETEMLDGFTGVLGTAEDQSVAASGSTEGKLIESNGLTTGSEDAGTGSSSESQGGDCHLGELKESVVIGDSADNNDGSLLLLVDVGHNAGQGHGRSVDLGRKQTSENNLVEGRVGST